jgi:hypothetical protein
LKGWRAFPCRLKTGSPLRTRLMVNDQLARSFASDPFEELEKLNPTSLLNKKNHLYCLLSLSSVICMRRLKTSHF